MSDLQKKNHQKVRYLIIIVKDAFSIKFSIISFKTYHLRIYLS